MNSLLEMYDSSEKYMMFINKKKLISLLNLILI